MEPTLSLSMSLFKGHFVYGIRRDERYLYIGKSTSMLRRMGGHHAIGPRFEPLPTDQLDVWKCSSAMEAKQLEYELIQQFVPQYNYIHKFEPVNSIRDKGR